jgi:pSer/pThr/pTyr-binding forkhead associated (FHA) protein
MGGPAKGNIFYITKPVVEIGRAAADIVINDPEISSRHCQLEIRGETGYLTDLGSTNGILLDGDRVKSCQLNHLTEFLVGGSTLMFTVTSADRT